MEIVPLFHWEDPPFFVFMGMCPCPLMVHPLLPYQRLPVNFLMFLCWGSSLCLSQSLILLLGYFLHVQMQNFDSFCIYCLLVIVFPNPIDPHEVFQGVGTFGPSIHRRCTPIMSIHLWMQIVGDSFSIQFVLIFLWFPGSPPPSLNGSHLISYDAGVIFLTTT